LIGAVARDASPARSALQLAVGVAALLAPALHSITDLMEWAQQGFSTAQLWLNFAAFLPMPWLLLGLYVLHDPKPGAAGLVGALLYGAAFTYFAHSALYAIAEGVPDYAALWQRLGAAYTAAGVAMVCGGLLFGASVLRAGWLPRLSVLLFLAGVGANLVLGLLPVPDILQTVGSAVRNLGLALMGYAVLFRRAHSL
jgi:hypothetical protein